MSSPALFYGVLLYENVVESETPWRWDPEWEDPPGPDEWLEDRGLNRLTVLEYGGGHLALAVANTVLIGDDTEAIKATRKKVLTRHKEELYKFCELAGIKSRRPGWKLVLIDE